MFHLRKSGLCVRIHFGVVENLVVDMLLLTPFIKLYTRGIFPVECKLIFWHLNPAAVINSPAYRANASTAVVKLADESATDDKKLSLLRVAKQAIVQPDMPAPVLVHSKRSDLMIVEPIILYATRTLIRATRDVMDVTTGLKI